METNFHTTHLIAELPKDPTNVGPDSITPASERVSVSGRLIQVNQLADADWLFLYENPNQWIQLYVTHSNEAVFTVFKKLDIGNIVGAIGALFRTRKGKRALLVEELRIIRSS